MTFQQELNSWLSPMAISTSSAPELDAKAPSTSKLPMPNANGKPTVITFLRHCGCPFSEKTFLDLRNYAHKNNEINFVAVSHSDENSTDKWVAAVGGEGNIQVIVDAKREIYAQWGLGVSSAWHVLNPWSLWSVYRLGKQDGIWNKPTESGSRWQTAGSFAVDGQGVVKWLKISQAADDLPDFKQALQLIGVSA